VYLSFYLSVCLQLTIYYGILNVHNGQYNKEMGKCARFETTINSLDICQQHQVTMVTLQLVLCSTKQGSLFLRSSVKMSRPLKRCPVWWRVQVTVCSAHGLIGPPAPTAAPVKT